MSAMSQQLQKLLSRPEVAGIYHLPHGDCKALKQASHALNFGWLQADFGELQEITAILEKLGKDLGLPDWYGANYDALADCLADLSWNTAPGYVLLISGADELHAHDETAFDTLNDVLTAVIESWQEENVPFWVFYDMRPNGLATLPTLTASQ